MHHSQRRKRALHASRAVALGGAVTLATGCAARNNAPASPAGADQAAATRPTLEIEATPLEPTPLEPTPSQPRPQIDRDTPVTPLAPQPETPRSAAELAQEGSGAAPEATPGTATGNDGPGCFKALDGVCPEGCDRNNDADCCENDPGSAPLCTFLSNSGCVCAVIGPFAPPAYS